MRPRKVVRVPLPPSCHLCAPFGGLYRNFGTDDAPRMARCDCARGKALGLGTKWGKPPKKRKGPAVFDGKAAAGQDL